MSKAFEVRIGAVDDGVYGQLQAPGFELDIDDAVSRLDISNRCRGVGDHVFDTFRESQQEGFHGGRVFFEDFGCGNDGVAVELDTKFRVRQHHHIGYVDAARLQVEQRGEGKAGDGIHITTGQHGFAQRWVHGGPLHTRDVVGLGKNREGTASCVKHRRAQFLAAQVSRRFDT